MLISEIRDELISEVGGDSDDTELQTKIFGFIKSAMRQLPRHVLSRTLLTTASVSLSANANSVSLPSDFVSERYVYRKNTEGKPVEIRKLSWTKFHEENPTIAGSIYYYTIRGKTIYFDKKSVSADTIYIEHFKQQVGASFAASDSFFGNDDEIETVKNLVKEIYYGDYQEDEKKAARATKKAALAINSMNADYERLELPTHVEET